MSVNNDSPTNWKFFAYPPGYDGLSDSGSHKHFDSSTTTSALIRESIQNSLDALDQSASDDPVHINIALRILKKSACSKYFSGLEPHYKAAYPNKEFNLFSNDEMKFLILEDFNTTGLSGDKKNNFFKDNIRTDSGNSSGGSHGIGKVVFYESSKIRSFFLYTIYDEIGTNKTYFRGTCKFVTHKLNGLEFLENGKYDLCAREHNTFIESLFQRTESQKGLSIAIPVPQDEIKLEHLKEAIIEEHYYPIVAEKLTIKLLNETIDAKHVREGKNQKLSMITNFIKKQNRPDYEFSIGETKKALLDPNDAKQIDSELNDGNNVYIRFNIPRSQFIKSSKQGSDDSYLDFLIAKKLIDKKEDFDFWRENTLIKDACKRNKSSSEYHVIVLINGADNELSHLLRLLENPSHTDWKRKLSKASTTLSNGTSSIRYKSDTDIQNFVKFITHLPQIVISEMKPKPLIDKSYFSDLFPDHSRGNKKSTKGSVPKTPKEPTEKMSNNNSNFSFSKNRKSNGFSLSLTDNGKQKNISNIEIVLAYGTNQDKPFEQYDKRDFDLQHNIKVRLLGGKQLTKYENRLSCQINDVDLFKVSLSGFDPDRELKIDIKESVDKQ